MRILISLIIIAALAVAAWLTRDRWLPAPPPVASTESNRPATGRSATASSPTSTPTSQGSASSGSMPRPPTGTVRQQAEHYVAKLTEPEPEPLKVERADHFVTREQVMSLVPAAAVETTSINRMRDNPSLKPDTPITVVRQVEQVERVTPEKLIARSGGKLDAPIQVLIGNKVEKTTVRQVLEQAKRTPERPIDIVTHTEYFEQTTPRELIEQAVTGDDEPVRVVRAGHGLETSSIGELMRFQEVSEDSLFYVRTVRPGDVQGIWGIVHDGIIDNFARGMAIQRGREINTYQVDIPQDADERQADSSSSYLGKLIFKKARDSHVYNFNLHRMGQNPDRIFPGQEIVIINFKPQELIDIYEHFVEQRG